LLQPYDKHGYGLKIISVEENDRLSSEMSENLTLSEPLPVRLLRRFREAVHVQRVDGQQVPEAHQRPLMDRIDIHLEVPRVPIAKLQGLSSGDLAGAIRARVKTAPLR
jgi:hypothetical protein